MPKRTDIHKILILGSGPIVIGQACEFDYSGTQACKALRGEGFKVILVNSNPATIMTDPEIADRTYVEPLTVQSVTAIIERERPDALLPTVGGQTGLNLSVALAEAGVLQQYGVRMIGANLQAVRIAEDRRLFKQAMDEIGLLMPEAGFASSPEEAWEIARRLHYPLVIRPSFTLGGTGGGIAYNDEEFRERIERGLDASPIREIEVEESVLGWKEFELEVMRDLADNVVIICSIENFDPMGVHTGDSITVAPAQTLTDREYQRMRDAAIAVIRKVGVETGGSNIQFAVDPQTGELRVIEMNPRVSRSSALASKATGFPIAKIAALVAVGYTLDEIPNDITRKTPASFEPTLDYVVVKIPKWAFEKFPSADTSLTTQMKSVGEVMAIGRSFNEAFLKAMRSLEQTGRFRPDQVDDDALLRSVRVPSPQRCYQVIEALRRGVSTQELQEATRIDPWFLDNLRQLARLSVALEEADLATIPNDRLREAKRFGFSDAQIAHSLGCDESAVRHRRMKGDIRPTYLRVDTCAAEFESFTPYLYSTYELHDEAAPQRRRKIMILGSGPNRIGQGIEFDYCCCHAAFALREDGYETIMINCNPETVSTDYDTSDRLYFEPLTFEDVLNIYEEESPVDGVIVQFGGQTPLNLALPLYRAGVPIIGTSPESIDLAEDRKRFGRLLEELDISQAENGTATGCTEALEVAQRIGYPVLVRPSYVLGGRAMVVAYDDDELESYVRLAVEVTPERPVLIDRFLEGAVEVDVDALSDGFDCVIAGIQEHIEEAGIHSGDSSAVLPPYSLGDAVLDQIRSQTRKLAQALQVIGLMNVQLAIKDGRAYVLEVNPRASRTVPFVSKASGVPIAKIAARVMTGRRLSEFHLPDELEVQRYFIKTPVFPFNKFPGVDPILGPEMRSTGEVMGVGESFGAAFNKALLGAGTALPLTGTVFLSVNDREKRAILPIARRLLALGFELVASRGTAAVLEAGGVPVRIVFKVNEGRPHIADLIKSREIHLVINTPLGRESFYDEKAIRRAAMQYAVPCITTITGANAAVSAIESLRQDPFQVMTLQEYHESRQIGARSGPVRA